MRSGHALAENRKTAEKNRSSLRLNLSLEGHHFVFPFFCALFLEQLIKGVRVDSVLQVNFNVWLWL